MTNKNILTPVTSIPAPAKRGRPVGTGHVWPKVVAEVRSTPGAILAYPQPVWPATAQDLRSRYGLNITTRTVPGTKKVNMFITAPALPKPKRVRKPATAKDLPSATHTSQTEPVVPVATV